MSNGNKVPDDFLDYEVEERFGIFGMSDFFSKWHIIVSETIQSWYSGLGDKELKICEGAFYTMWDLHSGNSAMYDELVERLLPVDREYYVGDEKIFEKHSSPFKNEEDIHATIACLVSKGIFQDVTEIWHFGTRPGPDPPYRDENIRLLRFVREVLYKELISASNENFIRCTDEFFRPQRKGKN